MRVPGSLNATLAAAHREPRIVVGLIYPTGSIYLTNKSGLSNVPGNVVAGVLTDISSSSQTLRPDDARATIGTLSFSAVDLSADVTAELRSQLNQGRGLRGKEVRVWTGDTDNFNDYERVETYVIDRAVSVDGRTYRFTCSDRTREQRVSIFEQKSTRLSSSISATDTTINVLSAADFETVAHTASFSDAPSSTVGYALVKKTKEIFRYTGKTATSFTGVTRGVFGTTAQALTVDAGTDDEKKPEVLEFIYLEMPAPQLDYAVKTGKIKGTANTLPAHWHMGIDEAYIDGDSYDDIGVDLYDPSDVTAGLVMRFGYLEKIDGKKFVEEQVHMPAGTFVQPTADGLLRLRRMVSLVSGAAPLATLGPAEVINHTPVRHMLDRVINRIRILWNYNGEGFTRETLLFNSTSISAHGESPLREIKLYGLHVSRHSPATIRRIFDTLSDRYGTPPIELSARLSRRLNGIEVADTVRLALERVKDFTGTDYLDRTFEVQSRRINWRTGALDVQLFGSTAKPRQSDAGGTGAYLADSWYSSTGTSLSSVLSISGGAVTSNGSLTGGSDARTAVFYYAGDLTINSGVTVTISDNVQLRIRGTLTVNGKIDGAANGIAAPTDPNAESGAFQGWPDPFANGGYLGSTHGGSGIYHSGGVYARNVLQAIAYAKNESAPRLALDIASDGSALSGLPGDIRGTPGMYGQPVVASNDLNYRVGGDGGDGGAGLVIVCRGLSFGVSGEIDLSGGDGSPPSGGSVSLGGVSADVYAGGGAGGSPGALYVVLDGDDLSYPDLSTTFTANQGSPGYLGTPGVESYAGGSLTFESDPGCGITIPSGGVDMWEAAQVIQYVPPTLALGDSDDEAVLPPDNLSATVDDLGVLLEWDPPPGTNWNFVSVWESIDNDRSNALEVARVQGSTFYKASATIVTRYYWIRAVSNEFGPSEWEPVSSTAGVEAAYGGGASSVNMADYVYYQSAPPVSPAEGWLWVDTDDDNLYRYNGASWDFVSSADALNLTNGPAEGGADVTANNADAIVFRQSAPPGSPQAGWLWVDTDDDTVYRYNGATWDFIGSADALNLNNAPAEAGADVTSNNASGIIFRQGTAPSSPLAGWIWVDSDDGNVYRHNGTAWIFIGSEDVLQLVNAPAESGADVTSNNAATIIFRQSSAPGSPQAGWIWVDSDDGNVYRHNGATWDFIGAEDVLQLVNAPAEAGADSTANNADAIIFRQSTAPGSAQTGWLWVDTDDGSVYRYNGATWDFIGSDDALSLINGPAEAGADVTSDNADAIIFRQSGAPGTPQTGWIWVDTDDDNVYRYSGSSWDFIGSGDALNLTNGPAEADADATGNHPTETLSDELVLDRDFELSGLDYWGGHASLTKTTTSPKYGSQCLQVTNQVGVNADVYQYHKGTTNNFYIPVEPGERIYVSGWIWCDVAAGYGDLGVRTFDDSQTPITWVEVATNTVTSAWEFCRGEWVVPEGVSYFVIWFRGQAGFSGTTRWDRVSYRKSKPGADVTGDRMTGFQSLLPNWNFAIADSEGKPAGIAAVEGINDRSQLDFGDIGIEILAAPDTSVAYGFPAVPIDDTAQYLVTIKHRSSAADTDGLYLRFQELASGMGAGYTHIGSGAAGVQPRDSNVDLVANGAMPGTTEQTDTYTYTPTVGTQFASFSFYNWTGSAVDYYVRSVQITRINNPEAQIFLQSAAPSSPRAGWIWIDSDDSRVYRYNGSTWDQIAADDLANIGGLLGGSQLASSLTITSSLNLTTNAVFRSGQTAFDTGTGFFLEYNGGSPRFSFGSSSGEKMIWDVSGAELQTTQTETGSFTGSFNDFSSGTINKTVNYVRQGRLVTLYVTSALSSTGNGNNFYMTGIPAALRPTVTQEVIGASYKNNNISPNICHGRVQASGRIDFYRNYPGSNELTTVAWTSGQARGFTADWRFSYYIDQ